jgi:hypothetical protein
MGLLYQPRMIVEYGAVRGMRIGKENTYPSVTFSTTNSTRHCLGLNPGLRGWKPVTNRLSYGIAYPTNSSEHGSYNIADSRSPSEEISRFFILLMGWDWVHLVLRPLFGLLSQPQMTDDDDDCGAISEMRICNGNRTTRRKPAPVLLCPPQISHDLSWVGTRASAVGRQRLTAWAMARFNSPLCMETEGLFLFTKTRHCKLYLIAPNFFKTHSNRPLLPFIPRSSKLSLLFRPRGLGQEVALLTYPEGSNLSQDTWLPSLRCSLVFINHSRP